MYKFEFPKATDITDLAFTVNDEYKNAGYVKIFIAPDVNDFRLIRILKGFTDYERQEGCFLFEIENINKQFKSEKLTLNKVKRILEEDDFSSWECFQFFSLQDAIDEVDGGYGINNLKE